MNSAEVSGRSFLVHGAARSGLAAVRLLQARGAASVVLADDNPGIDSIEQARILGVQLLTGTEAINAALANCQFYVKSPGIPPSNQSVQLARSRGIRIIGELELADALRPPGTKVLAVTGTNGKTTTTAWAAHLLNNSGIRAVAVGNIGRPFSEAILEPSLMAAGTVFVAEASSFQLEDTEDFHPEVAIMTNFTPDHLDRYESLDHYFAAKQRIWKSMAPTDLLVVNGQDPSTPDFIKGCSCKVGRFLGQTQPGASAEDNCAWVDPEGMIWIRNATHSSEVFPLLPAVELALPGPHNLENGLAAAMAVIPFLDGGGLLGLIQGLKNFGGVPHRIEACGEINGIKFFNDSKATNVDATEKALRSFPPGRIILIAGGRDKHSDYSAIAPLVRERVRVLVTLGEAAPLIEAAWGPPVTKTRLRARDMAEAVDLAAASAKRGDIVLLSPACASFDQYHNYEERGDDFKERVINFVSMQTL